MEHPKEAHREVLLHITEQLLKRWERVTDFAEGGEEEGEEELEVEELEGAEDDEFQEEQ